MKPVPEHSIAGPGTDAKCANSARDILFVSDSPILKNVFSLDYSSYHTNDTTRNRR